MKTKRIGIRGATANCVNLATLAIAGIASAQVPGEAPATQTVVVTATRHALALADAPAAISVVTRQQIAERGADNVLEAIREQTGVTIFARTIAGRKTVSLRGMDGRHTLFLVDGMRIGASDGVIGHSDFQLDWVPIEEIERIEVVRGPLSALYGAEALGGVVQIVTRAPSERLEGSALVEGLWADGGRGGDGHRVSARISGALAPGLTAALSLADSRRQAVTSFTDPRIDELEARHKKIGALRLQWQPGAAHTLALDLRAGDEAREATSVERGGLRRVYQSTTAIERRHGALGWSADWGGALDLRSSVRAYASRIGMDNVRSNGVAALRPNRLDDRVLDAQTSARAGEAQLVTAGVEWRDERLHNLGLPGGEANAEHRSVFAQDEISFGRDLTLTAGLRHDEHERFGGQWSPRLYAVWRLAPQWVAKGGVTRGFKPPTLKQITPGYQEDEGPNTYFSDPALRPETNRAWELGAANDSPEAGVQAMVFDNRVQDLIVPRLLSVVAGRGQYVFANLDRARLRGAEMSGRLRLPAGFALGASYQYLDAKDGAGARIEKRPRHSGSLALDWAQGSWRAGASVSSSAGMRLATAVPAQPLQPVPDTMLVSAHIGRAFGERFDLALGVSNLNQLTLAEKSSLYTWAEAPRTWRLALRGRL